MQDTGSYFMYVTWTFLCSDQDFLEMNKLKTPDLKQEDACYIDENYCSPPEIPQVEVL